MYFIGERIRKNRILFRVSDDEKALITEKMAVANIINREAYLRKMALDGYIVRLDFKEIRKMTSLLSNISGNINQIARLANSTGELYKSDIADILDKQNLIWEQNKEILLSLASIKM